jgi:hypothetical protein
MKHRAIDHRNDWSTPRKQFDQWNSTYNFSTFDPCPIYGNIEGLNGLVLDWEPRTFVNPPYELKAKASFIHKAIEQLDLGISSCFLLPVSTSTKLFQDFIQPHHSGIDFIRGRLKFEGVNSRGQWVNPGLGREHHPAATEGLEQVSACGMHDSMLVFFGKDW